MKKKSEEPSALNTAAADELKKKEVAAFEASCGQGSVEFSDAADGAVLWTPEMAVEQCSRRALEKEWLRRVPGVQGMVDERVLDDDEFLLQMEDWSDLERTMHLREYSGIFRQNDEESLSGNVLAKYDPMEAYKCVLDGLSPAAQSALSAEIGAGFEHGGVESETSRAFSSLRTPVPDASAPMEEQRAFVQKQIVDDRRRFLEWKKMRGQGWGSESGYFRSTPQSAATEGWWAREGGHCLPHQGLHGTDEAKDDESDMPLNTYWHKATMTPSNWHVLKKQFRANMVPGSAVWNELAFRNEVERQSMTQSPLSLKHWFVRRDEDLLQCHNFRCKMMDHSSLNEYWRLGELRWNRKYWLPYIRIGNWVIAPMAAAYSYYLLRHINPWYNQSRKERFHHEYARWKAMMNSGDADEYYTFCFGQKQHTWDSTTPMRYTKAPSVEDLDSIEKRTVASQVRMLLLADDEKDPYQ